MRSSPTQMSSTMMFQLIDEAIPPRMPFQQAGPLPQARHGPITTVTKEGSSRMVKQAQEYQEAVAVPESNFRGCSPKTTCNAGKRGGGAQTRQGWGGSASAAP